MAETRNKLRPAISLDDETFELLMDCIHCGFCLPTCPTFALTGDETDSPRGRLYYMRLLAEGRIDPNESVLTHLDRCLECRACETACPSGVRYGFLSELVRAQLTKQGKGPTRHFKLQDFLIRQIFPYPDRLDWLFLPLRIAQAFKATEWLNNIPMLSRAINTVPPLPSRQWRRLPQFFAAKNERKMRVGLITGCINSVVLSRTNWAAAEVLAAAGCEVVIPPEQGCCGSLLAHIGYLEDAKKLARQLILTFARHEPLDAIVVTAAGCGSFMKDYGHLFANDPHVADLAGKFAAKVKDFCELLDEIGLPTSLKPLSGRVTYHDPCHLAHGQNIREQPRKLIRQVPNIEFVELPESDWCCGGGGAYSLLQPEMSDAVLDRKMANIKATKANIVVTANIVCTMQIWYGIRKHRLDIKLMHIADFLRAALPE
jgi:glycolate oxidase iron-sulfur subunit